MSVRNGRPTRIPFRMVSASVAEFLRIEVVGGAIMLAAAIAALIWANSPVSNSYFHLLSVHFGPDVFHLRLSLADWAQDGLLSIFFFVAGLELKRELVTGDLADRRAAMLPLFSAVGGMVLPATFFLAIAAGSPHADSGWAIPIATDIAFALAVLAVAAPDFPRGLRVFLLSLAIVDDLGSILLIAILFSASLSAGALILAIALTVTYGLLQRARVTWTALYVPLAIAVWVATNASGVHATVAGIALGLLTRAKADPAETKSPVERLEHRVQPWSAGVAVPLFALMAAGVPLSGSALHAVITDRISWAIIAGLVLGKASGVLAGAALAIRSGFATLPVDLTWRDLGAVAMVTGCGFTVSLLIAELAFDDPMLVTTAKTAVLMGSVISAAIGAYALRRRARTRKALESITANHTRGTGYLPPRRA